MATRSGSVSLIIRTIRSVCARPASGPRWMSDTTAIRNPLNAGSSRRSRTGSASRSGGPSALAVPTPTRPTDAAPAATALVRARNIRRFTVGAAVVILDGRLGRGVAVASRLPLHPAPQCEPNRLQHEQRRETGTRPGRTRSIPATRTTPTRSRPKTLGRMSVANSSVISATRTAVRTHRARPGASCP